MDKDESPSDVVRWLHEDLRRQRNHYCDLGERVITKRAAAF